MVNRMATKNRPQKIRDTGGSYAAIRELFGKKFYMPIRTGQRAGTGPVQRRFPEPPPTWAGSLPEWAIYWAHTVLGLKEHVDFEYLGKVPYASGSGWTQIDFMELDLNIGIEVQGTFWHYQFSVNQEAMDRDRRIRLESMGLTVIFIDENDALTDPVYYTHEARLGRDHSLVGMGLA